MKISRIRFDNQRVLGDLDLLFKANAAHPAADTIVIAGNNGCEKTVILNEIFSTIGELKLVKKDKLSIDVEFEDDRVVLNQRIDAAGADFVSAQIEHGGDGITRWDNIQILLSNSENQDIRRDSSDFYHGKAFRPFRAFYSEASVGFISTDVSSIGTSDVDVANTNARKAGSEIGQQMLLR